MADDKTILIVGGGVIGVCSAYYLARGGFDVIILEKDQICAGCSYGNAGLVVPGHSIPLAQPGVIGKGLRWLFNPDSPFYIKFPPSLDLLSWLLRFRGSSNMRQVRRSMAVLRDLSYASLALFKELAAMDGFDFGFQQKGVLSVYLTDKGFEEGAREAQLLREAGISAKVLDASAALAIEPNLAPGIVGGIYFSDDAHLVPHTFVKGLAGVAEQMGVKIYPSTEVIGFKTGGRKITIVETTRGNFAPAEVVLAAGSWSPLLAESLGLKLAVQPAKGYSVTYKLPDRAPRLPLMLAEARVAVTPMADKLRLAGTLELAGFDFSINRRRVDAIVGSAGKYLALKDEPSSVEIWRGLRPCTPDGLPIICRPGGLDNLILATGHGTLGVSLGPITGILVSQLAARQHPVLDLNPLRLERF